MRRVISKSLLLAFLFCSVLLRAEGRPAVLEHEGDVRLEGSWRLPEDGELTIRATGRIEVAGWHLSAPGGRLRLEGASVVLDDDAHIDLSREDGCGGSVAVIASGRVAIAAGAVVEASGAAAEGGRILLAGGQVDSRGALLARGQGRIEVEAGRMLRFTSAADTGGGVLRLDPTNLTIGNFAGTNTDVTVAGGDISPSTGNNGQLDAANLAALLATNDVIVHTTSTAGPGTGLQAAITGDANDGDISVESPVVWNSARSLTLLAHDDLVVTASVQNAGSGAVIGVSGWDGVTTTGLDAASVAPAIYGNGNGDLFVLGSGTTLMAPGTGFGSRSGTTAARGRNIAVRGSTSAVLSSAYGMIGYRITVLGDGATGDVRVTGKGVLDMRGGLANEQLRYAQIGHGGPVDSTLATGVNQGDLSGTIQVAMDGAITGLSGVSLGYVQIGHGGDLRQSATRGNVSGDITVSGASLSLDTSGGASSAAYAMIGHGGPLRFGRSQSGNLSGNIDVSVTGNLLLDVSDQFGLGHVMIGHGGVVNTNGTGNPTFLPATLGTQSGDIHVTAGGDLTLLGGNRSGATQIGHGGILFGPGLAGAASGSLTVDVTGSVLLQAGTTAPVRALTSAMIGHGGMLHSNTAGKTAARGTITGDLQLMAGGTLRVLAGGNNEAWAQVGHGGMVLSLPGGATADAINGNLTVSAGDVTVQGGAGELSYSQIGHGGLVLRFNADAVSQGLITGTFSFTANGDLALLGGAEVQGTAYAQLGHGGQRFEVFGPTATQAGVAGSWTSTVDGETSLVDSATAGQWWLGHRTTGTLTSAPVFFETSTLDFTAGTGATNATISAPSFWERFVADPTSPGPEAPNASGGRVTLRVAGLAGNDGNLIVNQPLTVPASIANLVDVLSTDDLTVNAAVTNDGSSFLDLVADDANPVSPAFGPTALFTIGASGSITGGVRLYAVGGMQFVPGTYVPPGTAFGVWHEQSGSPVVGANFKLLPSADLMVTKSDTPDPVTPGNDIVYTINVTNNGPDAASSVSLSDVLPAGLTFQTLSAPGGWSCTDPGAGNNGTVTCTIASLGVGTATFTLTVQTSETAVPGTDVSNSATVTASTNDPSTGDETGTATTTFGPASADVSLTKTDSPDPVVPGSNITYEITVTNAGPSAASTVEWSDTIPAGTTFVSLAQPGGWSCTTPASGAGGTVTCSLATMGTGSASFTLIVAVDGATAASTVFSNTATVTSDTTDPAGGNESATAETTAGTPSASLSLTKTDSPHPVAPGANITYGIAITNAGPSHASTVSWTDTLPAGTTFVSLAQPGSWSCTTPAAGTAGTVTCSLASMAAGSENFTLVVAVGASVAPGTVLSNTATVTSATSDPADDTATTTVGAASADLTLTKTDSPDPVAPGANLTYGITITSAGPSHASTVSWTDTLPAGATFVSLAQPGSWSCTTPAAGAAGTVTCSLASMAAGSENFTLVVAVGASVAPGTVLSSTAAVTSATSDPADDTTTTTVGAASADLSLTKTDSPDPVAPGANLTYGITVTNAGPSQASSVSWTDTLPAGTTFVSLAQPGGWSCTTPAAGATGTVTCSMASMGVGGASFTLVVAVGSAVAPGTALTNSATVTSTTTDPSSGNETGMTETTVGPASANLSLTKTDSPDPVVPGANLTYTITVTNAGPSDASSVSWTDTLPAGTTFVSLSQPGGWDCTTPAAGAAGTVTCSMTPMAVGGASFTLTVAVDGSVAPGTVLSNTATATSTTSDPSTGNESETATTTVGAASADLSLTKTDSPDPVSPGTNLTYAITVTNAGPSPASTVSWSDTLPAGTTFVAFTSPGGWSCTTPAVGAAGTVTCSIASMAVSAPTFTLTVAVDSSVATGTVLTNSATVTSPTSDPGKGNETGTAATAVGTASADLVLTKTASPDPVTAGANITYAISLTNEGPSNAAAVEWTDTLPAGTTFVSLAWPAGWSCTTPAAGAAGTVTCTMASMDVGNAAFTLVVNVDDAVTAGTVLSNTATVTSDTSDPNGSNESDTATTTVSAAPASAQVSVIKTDAADPVAPGANIVYTITVLNGGPDNASSVAIADTLPAGTTFVSLGSPAGWSCTTPAVGANGTINCSVASLVVGNAVFTLTVQVDGSVASGTTLSNSVTVTSATADPVSGNETATETTSVLAAPEADLSVTKTDSPDPVTAGTNVTYTINVTNGGPGAASSVELSDILPAGLTFVSLSPAGGWTCTTPAAGANGTVTCSVASLGVGTASFTLVAQVAAGTAGGTVITNNVTVTSATADPDFGDRAAAAATTVSAPAGGTPSVSGTKTVSGSFVPGGTITYTIVLTNSGSAAQLDNPGAELTDVLPGSLVLTSANATSGTAVATVATNTVTWNGSIPAGGSVTVTIAAVISGAVSPGTTISNQGTISYDDDGNGTNEAPAVTDDPGAAGGANPTSFSVSAPAAAAEIPTLSEAMLFLLAALLAVVAMRR